MLTSAITFLVFDMNTILDQTNDLNGQLTHKLITLFPPPDFVKEASSDQLYSESAKLPARCYGDPIHKLYPSHTKESTWMSTLFFLNNMEEKLHTSKEAKDITERMDWFASYFGIDKEVSQLKEQVKKAYQDPLSKLPNEDFALIITYKDGTTDRLYPLRNTQEIEKAASYLEQFKSLLPLVDRQQMAQNILDKVTGSSVKLKNETHNFLERQAGYGVCSSEDAASLLRSRANLLTRMNKAPELRTELQKMADMCLKEAEHVRKPGPLVKLAATIDQIDRDYGLYNLYGEVLTRPEDVLFGINIKTAEAILDDHCTTTTGNTYQISDFSKLAVDDLRDVMGIPFAEAVSSGGLTVNSEKMADVLVTLPRPDAQLMDKLLSSIGITPVAKEAASHSACLDRRILSELATLR
jgi:hypothetical protein